MRQIPSLAGVAKSLASKVRTGATSNTQWLTA
jgi:hypothetical protein